jgi:hypothetical protein
MVIGLVVLQAGFAGPASAAPDQCDRRLRRAISRSVTTMLQCEARARRHGDTDTSSCIGRAAGVLATASARYGTACLAFATARDEALSHCMDVVSAAVDGTGRCAARKLVAAARRFRSMVRTEPPGSRAPLCRAFTRAGECSGDCSSVDAALLECAGDLRNPPPPSPPVDSLPPPAADDLVVAFDAYAGDAVSTTTVAGQDEVTTTARVLVEAGGEPLYVVLSAGPSIWRFEGATSRVARVVLLGGGRQGVIGIAPERVV